MKKERYKINVGITLVLAFIFTGLTNNAFGFLGFGSTASWKEEVLLHNSSKIIVERWQSFGGRHEIGQLPPVKEQTIKFTMPGTKQIIKWKDEYSDDIGHSNFYLMALDIVNGTPYIVTELVGMLAYNKWGRPNPPYIIFKYTEQKWNQIPLKELPAEIKQPNVIVNIDEEAIKVEQKKWGFVSAKRIKELNSSLMQEEDKTTVRTPLKTINEPIMVPTEEGGWLSIDWFTSQPSYEACRNFSKRKKVRTEHCPCNAIFKGGK